MRPLGFTALAVFTAAILAAAPVSAQDNGRNNNGRGFQDDGHGRFQGGQRHFGGGGGGQHHFQGGGERRHGGGAGFAAPALILGLGAAAVGAAIANGHRNSYNNYDEESCGGHYERVYDDWGNYRGKRFVSDC